MEENGTLVPFEIPGCHFYARKLTYQDRIAIAETLADELGTSYDAAMECLSRFWAPKQLVNDQWRQWNVPQVDRKSTSNMKKLKNRLFPQQISEEAQVIIDITMNPDCNPVDDYWSR